MQLINQIRQTEPASDLRLRGVGLTIQGVLNLDGVVIRAPFLDWSGVDLRYYLRGLAESLPRTGGKATSLLELVERLAAGEAIAHTVVQEWAEILARRLISVASLLNQNKLSWVGL